MKRQHQLVDQETRGVLTLKILCRQCMSTWWTDEGDLDREVGCPTCGHRATVQTDPKKVLE